MHLKHELVILFKLPWCVKVKSQVASVISIACPFCSLYYIPYIITMYFAILNIYYLHILCQLTRYKYFWWFMVIVMVFNATFNNISVILCHQFYWILVEETGIPKKTTNLSPVTDKLYHIIWSWVHLSMKVVRTHNLVVIGIDCTGSSKSNYHMITTKTAPCQLTRYKYMYIWKSDKYKDI